MTMFIENPPTLKRPASRRFDEDEIAEVEHAHQRDPAGLLRWAIERFSTRFAVVTALQAEGIVLLDLARKIDPELRVITIDTGRLPSETHALIATVRRRLGIAIEMVHPDRFALARLVSNRGPNLFYDSVEDRVECCRVRKVEPLERALIGIEAWVTGLRREQSRERRNTRVVAIDPANRERLKLAPLAHWSEDEVWSYIREHELPYHPLYDRGYRSIGCAPCTRPVAIGEPARAGRWWWEGQTKKECGLHMAPAGIGGST